MQYAMWAFDRSADLHQQGFHNMLRVQSEPLGVFSMAAAMALDVTAVTVTVTMLVHGLRTRSSPR